MPEGIEYSERYYDESYEYRHVTIPKSMAEKLRYRVMREVRSFSLYLKIVDDQEEWRAMGICQSPGWMHYDIHPPEKHILLFKRPRGFDSLSHSDRQKWKQQVTRLINEKNTMLALKFERNKKQREILRASNGQRNVPFGGMDNAPPEARPPLAPISHLFY